MKLEVVFNDGVKKTIDNVKAYNVVEESAEGKGCEISISQMPTEGKKFLVKPSEIDRSLFEDSRIDPDQEEIRKLIKKHLTKSTKSRRSTALILAL